MHRGCSDSSVAVSCFIYLQQSSTQMITPSPKEPDVAPKQAMKLDAAVEMVTVLLSR